MIGISRTFRTSPIDWFCPAVTGCLNLNIHSVLGKNRHPLGYVDVAQLKQKWEAGEANPVCYNALPSKADANDVSVE